MPKWFRKLCGGNQRQFRLIAKAMGRWWDGWYHGLSICGTPFRRSWSFFRGILCTPGLAVGEATTRLRRFLESWGSALGRYTRWLLEIDPNPSSDEHNWHRSELLTLETRSAPGAISLAAAMPVVMPLLGNLGQEKPKVVKASTLDRISAGDTENAAILRLAREPRFVRSDEVRYETKAGTLPETSAAIVNWLERTRFVEHPFANPLDPAQWFDNGLGSTGNAGAAPASADAEATPEGDGGGGGGGSSGSTDLDVEASGGSGGASMDEGKSELQDLVQTALTGAFGPASRFQIGTGDPQTTSNSTASEAEILENIARFPLRFEQHEGEDGSYFFARGAGYGIYITPTEATLGLLSFNTSNQERAPIDPFAEVELPTPEVHTLSLKLVGSNANASGVAQEEQPGAVNYLMGDDPSEWRTNVTTHGNVIFHQIYHGIDLMYYGTAQHQLQFDFIVAPGANPNDIRFNFEGANQVDLAEDGSLLLHTAGGTLVQKAPVLYQEIDGVKHRVEGSFALHQDGSIGFNVGIYDTTKELIIDPVLSYSSYLGGNGADTISAVRAGSDGSAYVTGWTASTNLPTLGGSGGSPFQGSKATSYDAFVAKVAPDGSSLVYLTYLGGNSNDFAYALDVDDDGYAYIAGGTNSTNFPVSSGAYDTTHNGNRDAFVFKLSQDGQSRVWATYVGGSGNDQANGIVVDANGVVTIAGATSSSNFPTSRALDSTLNGVSDAFVTRLNANGTALVYSTYYGGSNGESANGLDIDSAGNAIIVGHTDSSNLTTKNADQATYGGGVDMFIAKIVDPGSPSAVTLDYASFLGGSGGDVAEAVAVDGSDRAIVVGYTAAYDSTSDFPVLNSLQAFQGGTIDYSDAIVARYSSTGVKELATYLGGTGDDYGRSIDVDADGNMYLIGETYSSDIETVNPVDATYGGSKDAFITFIDTIGTEVVFQSYLGGSNVDTGINIAFGAGSVFAVGETYGSFPSTVGAFQTSFGGGLTDGFVAKYSATRVTIEATTPDAYEVGDIPGVFTVTRTGDLTNALTVNYRISGNATPGDDYTALTGTVIIPATQSQATITVDPIQDNTPEVDERVIARLEPSPDYLIGTPASAIVTIHDTTVSIEAIDDTAEGSGTPGRFTISRNGPNIGDLTVYYTIHGTAYPGIDYDFISDSVVITNGNGSVDVVINAIDDAVIEGTETVTLTLFQDPLYAIDGTADTATINIDDNDSTNTWPMDAFILNWDPLTGQGLQQTGNNQVSYAVDLDQSPGIVQGGNSYLVYNSDFVDVRPIIQATIISDPNAGLPDQISAVLTWDGGTPQTPVNFDPSNLVMGVPFTIAVQVEDAVTETDRYSWSLEVTIDYPGTSNDIVRTTSNETSFVVVQDEDNALGAGWSMSMVDRLYDIDNSNGPAGKLRVYGTGSWRFYEDTGGGTFASEPGDNGTLAASGGGFVYTTPDGQTWTFNSAGMQTAWTSADGQETLAYTYIDADSDGDTDDLQTVTSVDGGVATYTYSSNVLSSISGAVRSYTFTHDGNKNLTTINTSGLGTQTYTYDTDADWLNHLEKQQIGQYFTDYAYTEGALTSSSRGGLYDMEYAPAALIGLVDPEMRPLEGSTQDAAMESVWTMDERGRPLTYRDTSTGNALTIWNRDSTTYVQSMTDAAGLTTTYTRDADGDITQDTLPDGSLRTYVYDTFGGNKRLKNTIDENGNKTTMLYDSAGHLTTYTNALNETTTYAWTGTGLLLSTTDALGHTVSFAYDGFRRQTAIIEALGTGSQRTTSMTYQDGEVFNLTDPLGRTTSFAYDAAKRLALTIEALGEVEQRSTTFIYDGASQLVGVIDPLGHITSIAYDAARRQIGYVEAFGTANARSIKTAYDDANRVSEQTDALGRKTQIDYDVAQRRTTSVEAVGLPEEITTVASFNVVGNPLSTQTSLGQNARWSYDSRHRVTTVVQAELSGAQATSVMEYDPVGNVIRMVDPSQRVTTSTFDGLNRPESVTSGAGSAEAETTNMKYDDAGNLLSFEDGRGKITSYGYDAVNQPIVIIVDYGGLNLVATYSYDPVGNLSSMIDPRGFETAYEHDNLNRRTVTREAVGEPEERETSTSYDEGNRVVSIEDPNGTETSFAYDELDRVVAVTEALGTLVERTTTYVYNAVDTVRAIINSRGFRTTYAYDGLNREIGMTEAVGTTVQRRVSTEYDQAGRITRTTDARGFITDYFYDDQHRRIEMIEAAGTSDERSTTYAYNPSGDLISMTDPRGFVTTYAYDELHRQISMTEAVGTTDERSTETLYDKAGNVTETVDGLGRRITFTYDGRNRLIEVEDALGNLATTVYDESGNIVALVDQLGHRTTFLYDALDRQIETIDPLGHVVTTVYDSIGNAIANVDERGNRTSYTYDALHRLSEVEDALGFVSTTTYDSRDNVVVTVNERGFRTTSTYDPLDRRIATVDAVGNVSSAVYDPNDNLLAFIDELGFRTSFNYDSLNRRTATLQPSGGVNTSVYDANDNVVKTVDAVGNVTTFVNDALNRTTRVIDARGGMTTTVFDAVDNVVRMSDPEGNITTYVYDVLDRQTQEIDPHGNTITTTYDAASRMTARIDRLGRKREFDYDNDDRLVGETWRDEFNAVVNALTMTYDETDNLLSEEDADGAVTMTYDALNRVESKTDVWGKALTFTYDPTWNRTVVQDSEGGVTTSVYDGLNRLTRRDFTGNSAELRLDLSYTARSEMKSEVRYADLAGTTKVGSTSYTYDGTGRLTHLHHLDDSDDTLAEFTYTYDLADRVITETLNGTTKTYVYDATDQVTDDGVATYSYDLAGNRDMAGYQTDAANRIVNDGVFTYTYDAEGNLIKQSKGLLDETWTYSYDNANQLVAVEKRAADGGTLQMAATYVYDALGDRIEKEVWDGSTTVTRFVYDGDAILLDLDGSSSLTTRYLLGDETLQRFARVSSAGDAAWLLADRLGSIRDMTDDAGLLIATLEYDGFGVVVVETSPPDSGDYLYAGYRFDRETGLYRPDGSHWGRLLKPEIAQWMQEDPIRVFGDDYNYRRYVGNNAPNLVDPTGRIATAYKNTEYGMRLLNMSANPDDPAVVQEYWFAISEAKQAEVNTFLNDPAQLFARLAQAGHAVFDPESALESPNLMTEWQVQALVDAARDWKRATLLARKKAVDDAKIDIWDPKGLALIGRDWQMFSRSPIMNLHPAGAFVAPLADWLGTKIVGEEQIARDQKRDALIHQQALGENVIQILNVIEKVQLARAGYQLLKGGAALFKTGWKWAAGRLAKTPIAKPSVAKAPSVAAKPAPLAQPIDFITKGRLGGKLYSKQKLKSFATYLRNRGITLRVGDKYLPKGKAGGFNYETKELLLRSNPTVYEVWHEMSHVRQYIKLGPEEYAKLPRSLDFNAPEQFAFDMLRNLNKRWKALNAKERQHAIEYIESVGGLQ